MTDQHMTKPLRQYTLEPQRSSWAILALNLVVYVPSIAAIIYAARLFVKYGV